MKRLLKKILPNSAQWFFKKIYDQYLIYDKIRDPRINYINHGVLGSNSDNEWIRKSSQIEGWLFQGEHEYLWKLATLPTKGNILEIGTWMGKSACIFAGACKNHQPGSKVICCDTFLLTGTVSQKQYHEKLVSNGTFYQFINNATKHGFVEEVIPLATLSYLSVPLIRGPMRLVFIDGTHDRNNCHKDVEVCFPLIARGGILAIHDAHGGGWPDLEHYVKTELIKRDNLEPLETVGTIMAFKKISE